MVIVLLKHPNIPVPIYLSKDFSFKRAHNDESSLMNFFLFYSIHF